jgi:histidinol-phosphate aminotransferase
VTIRPRDDVALMAGYHSPQVDVAVRLNTNESPYAPPESWRADLERAAAAIDWHRYPDRGATALRAAIGAQHGVGPEQVFVANGSNEVLQTVLLTYGGAGRTAAVWEPTYALHSHIARLTGTGVAVGERAPDFATDLIEVARVFGEAHPSIAFLCSPNNPTGVVDTEDTVRAVLDLAVADDALLVVDEAYGQFAPWSALDLVADDAPGGHPHVLQDLVHGRRPSGVPDRSRVGRRRARQGRLRTHLGAFKQLARHALDHVDDMNAGRHPRRGTGAGCRRPQPAPGRGVALRANFILFRPPPWTAPEVWRAARPVRPGAGLLRWPRL